MKKINIDLYGGKGLFGGREEPLRSETIFCKDCENCSLYKNGKCLNVADRFGGYAKCPVGKVEHAKGYTHRAAKYQDFREKVVKDEVYHKLSYPQNCDFAIIGNGMLFLNLRYVRVWKPSEQEIKDWHYVTDALGYAVRERVVGKDWICLPAEEVSIELLYRILSYQPIAMMGGVIKEYQDKIVPNILDGMRRTAPELYKQLTDVYPDLKEKTPNYVGRYAYIMSLRDGLEISDNGTKGIKQGDKIFVSNFTSSFLPFNGKNAICEITIDERATIKILDNNWVDDNTIFE